MIEDELQLLVHAERRKQRVVVQITRFDDQASARIDDVAPGEACPSEARLALIIALRACSDDVCSGRFARPATRTALARLVMDVSESQQVLRFGVISLIF